MSALRLLLARRRLRHAHHARERAILDAYRALRLAIGAIPDEGTRHALLLGALYAQSAARSRLHGRLHAAGLCGMWALDAVEAARRRGLSVAEWRVADSIGHLCRGDAARCTAALETANERETVR